MTVELTAEELTFMEKIDAMMAEVPLVLKWIKDDEKEQRDRPVRVPVPSSRPSQRRRY